jgi:GTP-dependent phosphoenolpyruvate carboxykinase
LRVIEWILARSRGEAEAVTTPIGHIPVKSSLDLTGLEISDADMKALLEVDRSAWHEDLAGQKKFSSSPEVTFHARFSPRWKLLSIA